MQLKDDFAVDETSTEPVEFLTGLKFNCTLCCDHCDVCSYKATTYVLILVPHTGERFTLRLHLLLSLPMCAIKKCKGKIFPIPA